MEDTTRFVKEKSIEARALDLALIERRREQVRRNIVRIEGKNRSEKYVARLAGISNDTPRPSRSERYVEWIGAAAMDDPAKLLSVKAFFAPIFNFTLASKVLCRVRDFWDVEQELNAYLAQLRRAVLSPNRIEARFHAVQIRRLADELLRLVDKVGKCEGIDK